ncbi:MAG: CPBP family intramembrane metalloprotease [Gemmatimonadetes bacterium]|nr:CPBP family intramembrane metalloprotease [Gemmatimonadota bacterium]
MTEGRDTAGAGARPAQRSHLGTLFRYEMRMLLRDTRTVLIAVVAPLVMFPILILVTDKVEERDQRRLEEASYPYAVTGSRAAWADAVVTAALAVDPAPGDTARAPVKFEKRTVVDPDSALASAEIALLVEGLDEAEWRALQEEEHARADSARKAREQRAGTGRKADSADSAASANPLPELDPLVPALRLEFRGRSDYSRRARDGMEAHLEALRGRQRDSLFAASGFPVPLDSVAPLADENVASAAREAGAFLGVALTPFLILLMLTGGSIVAADAIAGEKERGTLETLLTTAVRRSDIVRAKMLAVIAVGLAVAVINVANLLFYLVIGILDLPASRDVALAPADLAVLLTLFVPVTVLVASALLLLSGISKSYKEYQIYFFPVFLVLLVPTLAAVLPGIQLRSAVALIPLAGVAVAVREILVGTLDTPFVALAFLSTGAVAAVLARRTERALSTERLISASELDAADLIGGPALFPRHVLRWFLGRWVVLFVTSLWFGSALDIRAQLAVNLLGIFLCGSLLMVRRYRLDEREAFALRAPPAAAWPAVLLGAPSALILGIGLAELVNRFVFPVPREVLEGFGQALAGPDLPVWQIILFLAVMPGIFEELAFRGVLLHGVSRRFRPLATALVVGGIFGMFHVSLFRLVPTAWLGVVMAGVVLLTGSIYPSMLWHFLNNAIAIVPQQQGWIPEGFEVEPWLTGVAAVGFAVSAWILWRTRRPYPGLRPWRARREE